MVQLSPDQSVRGPNFTAPVSGDGGYIWWYLDAVSDDGKFGITLIAFIGSVFSPYYAWSGWKNPFDHCAINVALYRLDGAGGRWAMTERRADQLDRSAHHFAVGPSSLQYTGSELVVDIFEVCVPIPSRLKGRIRLIPEVETQACFDLDLNGRHSWRPLAPRARVELNFDSPNLSWSGDGYFDSNAGQEPLERAFAHWHWGRAHRKDDLRLFYDVINRSGPRRATFLKISHNGTVSETAPTQQQGLDRTFWGINREAWSDGPEPARVIKTLEDTPFYARSALQSRLEGERVLMMHETLNLDRLRMPVVRAMLPFRMPRRFL